MQTVMMLIIFTVVTTVNQQQNINPDTTYVKANTLTAAKLYSKSQNDNKTTHTQHLLISYIKPCQKQANPKSGHNLDMMFIMASHIVTSRRPGNKPRT